MVQRPALDDAASPVGGGHHREPPPTTSVAASNRLGIGIGYSQMHQSAGYNKLFTQVEDGFLSFLCLLCLKSIVSCKVLVKF